MCHGTHELDQVDLQITDPTDSASWVLKLRVYTHYVWLLSVEYFFLNELHVAPFPNSFFCGSYVLNDLCKM